MSSEPFVERSFNYLVRGASSRRRERAHGGAKTNTERVEHARRVVIEGDGRVFTSRRPRARSSPVARPRAEDAGRRRPSVFRSTRPRAILRDERPPELPRARRVEWCRAGRDRGRTSVELSSLMRQSKVPRSTDARRAANGSDVSIDRVLVGHDFAKQFERQRKHGIIRAKVRSSCSKAERVERSRVTPELAPQRVARDAEHARRVGLRSAARVDHVDKCFRWPAARAHQTPARTRSPRSRPSAHGTLVRQALDVDDRAARERRAVLHGIGELAHVARPRGSARAGACRRGEAELGAAASLRDEHLRERQRRPRRARGAAARATVSTFRR